MIPKAFDHILRYPDPRLKYRDASTLGGQNDEPSSNIKLRKSKNPDKWTRNLEDMINLNIYNAERCSEGCKKTFDIENTNITGFVRTFHILKKDILLNMKDMIEFYLN